MSSFDVPVHESDIFFGQTPSAQGSSLDLWTLGQIRDFLETNPPRNTIQQITGRSLVLADPDYVEAEESTSSSTWGDLTTTGPQQLDLPAGKYIFWWGAACSVATGGSGIRARMGVSINGAAVDESFITSVGTERTAGGTMIRLVTLTADSNDVITKYQSADNTTLSYFARRYIASLRFSD